MLRKIISSVTSPDIVATLAVFTLITLLYLTATPQFSRWFDHAHCYLVEPWYTASSYGFHSLESAREMALREAKIHGAASVILVKDAKDQQLLEVVRAEK